MSLDRLDPTAHGKESVRTFWQKEACGERYGEEQEAVRDRLEPEIIAFANFGHAQNLRVLEVGVGMGADLVRFARAGADVSGVDLTDRAIDCTRRRLSGEGLSAHLQTADAEHLPFPDKSFDVVYSWGVLHHTPDTAGALQECQRVLAPGGRLAVMVYHRWSWLSLAAWVRFYLLRGRPFRGLGDAVSYRNVESPGIQAFRPDEVRAMLRGMERVAVRPVLTHWDRRVAPGIARLLGDRFGWFLLAEGYVGAP